MKWLLLNIALLMPLASAAADVMVEYTFKLTSLNKFNGGKTTFTGSFTVNHTVLAGQGTNANGTNGSSYGYGGNGHQAITAFNGVVRDAEGNTLATAGLDNVGAYYLRLSDAFDPAKSIREQVVGLNCFSINLDSVAYHFAPISAANPPGVFIAHIRSVPTPESSM